MAAVRHSGMGAGRMKSPRVPLEMKRIQPQGPGGWREVMLDTGIAGTWMSGTTRQSGFLLVVCAQMVGILTRISLSVVVWYFSDCCLAVPQIPSYECLDFRSIFWAPPASFTPGPGDNILCFVPW